MPGVDLAVDMGDTRPPDPATARAAARTAASLAIRMGASAQDLRTVLEALGIIGPIGSGALVESAQIPKMRKRRTKGVPVTKADMCGARIHVRTPENTRVKKDGSRECIPCAQAALARRRERERAARRVS